MLQVIIGKFLLFMIYQFFSACAIFSCHCIQFPVHTWLSSCHSFDHGSIRNNNRLGLFEILSATWQRC